MSKLIYFSPMRYESLSTLEKALFPSWKETSRSEVGDRLRKIPQRTRRKFFIGDGRPRHLCKLKTKRNCFSALAVPVGLLVLN